MRSIFRRRSQNRTGKSRRRHALVRVLACLVVFCTAYSLIMPAITLTRAADQVLACAYRVHQHEDACYAYETDEEGNTQKILVCGQADWVVHEHNADCYAEADSEQILVCELPEIKAHEHDASCYDEQGILVCGQQELHKHSEDCYEEGHEGDPSRLTCGKLEVLTHVHGAGCFAKGGADTAGDTGEAVIGQQDTADYPEQVFTEKTKELSVQVIAEEGAFPAGTTMQVRDVQDEEILEAIRDQSEGTIRQIHAAEITFLHDEEEIEPLGPVKVLMTPRQPVEADGSDPQILHVENSGEVSKVEPAEDAARDEIAADTGITVPEEAVIFEADSFSVYALVYTVDFHYGEYTYCLPGEDRVLLSDLLRTLEIDVSLEDVASVSFSNEDYLEVQPVQGQIRIGEQYRTIEGNDWLLISRMPFETDESLRIVFKDGEQIEILVTDPEYLHDLTELLSKASLEINGVSYEPGNSDPALYHAGDNYTLSLTLQESPTKQFAIESGAVLTYPLPSGFVLPDDYETTVDISLGRKGTLTGNTVKYNKKTGNLEIRWNESNAELFEFFKSSNSAFVKIDLVGKIDAPEGEILFSDGAAIHVEKENLHNAIVAKDGVYNRQKGTVDYTVTVTSDGTTENLTLRDIPGVALEYLEDCVLDQDASAASEETKNGVSIASNGDGFLASIASMQDGEVLVFKYSARIDINNISVSGNASFEEMGNTAAIEGDSDPTDNTATHYERDIVFSSLQKDTTGVSGKYTRDGTKYRAIHWEIVTNETPNISLGGTTVSDFIDEEVYALCGYAGEGITVKAYDAEGNLKYTKEVSWNEMGVDTESDKSWTYTIPESDKEPYKYVITYDTEINMDEVNDGGEQVFVRNTARGKGGEDKALEIIHPDGNGMSFAKQIESYTTDSVTWRLTFTMSGEAYEEDYITLKDTLPGWWVPNAPNSDSSTLYKEMYFLNGKDVVGSLDIRGLYEGETYSVESNIKDNNARWTIEELTIDFYKDAEKTQKGLRTPEAGKEESRTITVLLTTKYNPEWPQKVKEAIENHYGKGDGIKDYSSANYYYKHQNVADLNGSKATDSVTIQGAEVLKRPLRNYYSSDTGWLWEVRDYWDDESLGGEPIYTWKNESRHGDLLGYGGYTFPVFHYQVLVTGVQTEEPIVIEDSYDTELFRLLRGEEYVRISDRTRVNGAARDVKFGALNNYDWFAPGRGPLWSEGTNGSTVEETESGLRFTINNPPRMTNGTYYSYYGVEYMLIPKDLEALKKIQKMAFDNAEGGYLADFVNTASFRGAEDEAKITIPITDDFTPVDKVMEETNDSRILSCVIELNEGQLKLNDGNPITVTDEYSSTLSVDFNSIRITTIPRDRADQVSYDFSKNIGTFEIPDETYVKIEYNAIVILSAEQLEQLKAGETVTGVELWNKVNMLGDEKTAEKTVDVETGSSGGADVPYITLYKYGSGHMEKGLKGAKFQLFEVSGEGNDLVYTPLQYQKRGDGFEIGQDVTFVSGENGRVDILVSDEKHGFALERGKRYALQEIETPKAEGIEYDLPMIKYLFSIGDLIYDASGKLVGEEVDYNQYVFMAGDTMTVRNTPRSATLHLSKAFEGNYADALTETQKNSIYFSLLRFDEETETYLPIPKLDEEGNPVTEQDEEGNAVPVPDPYYQKISYSQFTDGKLDVTGISAGWYKIVENVDDSLKDEEGKTIDGLSCKTSIRWDDKSESTEFEITQEDINAGLARSVSFTNQYDRKTVALTVKKVDGSNESPLKGAKFDLYQVTAGKREEDPLYENLLSDEEGILSDGTTTVFELLPGTYELVETETPAGYLKLEQAVTITVASNGTVSYDDGTTRSKSGRGVNKTADRKYTIEVSNMPGASLPATGGPGTTFAYLLGSTLLLLAGAALLRRQKKQAENMFL